MTRAVDVLALRNAYPAHPQHGVVGHQDMSVIEEPPADRHPVSTYVLEYGAAVIADAVRREAARGGQAYYLHNRVESPGASRQARRAARAAHCHRPRADGRGEPLCGSAS